jgi:ABC-2 type transport system ATP-binding protein
VLAQGTVGELSRGRGLEDTFLELTAYADRRSTGADAGRGAA